MNTRRAQFPVIHDGVSKTVVLWELKAPQNRIEESLY